MYFSKLPVHHPYTAQENVYQVYWIVKIVSACRRARRFWYHQNYPCWSRRTFLYFFLPRFVIRISYNVLFCASSFLEHQCIAGQTGLHYVTFLQILMDKVLQLDKFTLGFTFSRTKPFNYPVLIYLKKFYKVTIYIFKDWFMRMAFH